MVLVYITIFIIMTIDNILPNFGYLTNVISAILLSVILFGLSEYLKMVKQIIEYHKTGKMNDILKENEDLVISKNISVSEVNNVPENNNIKVIYCTNCGNKMPTDNKFCPKCGSKVE